MKPKTLAEALTIIPEYWPLTPGVDRRKKGDEILHCKTNKINDGVEQEWVDIDSRYYDSMYSLHSIYSARRPIPLEIRESEARWLLYLELRYVQEKGNLIKIASLYKQDNGVIVCQENSWYLYPKHIEALGGEQEVVKMLTEGQGRLMRWVAENR